MVAGWVVRAQRAVVLAAAAGLSTTHAALEYESAFSTDAELVAGRTVAPELCSGDIPETLRVGACTVSLSDPGVMVGEVCEPRPDAASRPARRASGSIFVSRHASRHVT